MSSGLDESILGVPEKPNVQGRLGALIKLGDDYIMTPFVSAEIDDDNHTIVSVESESITENMLGLLIAGEQIDIVLTGQEFKAIVTRVDCSRSYLRVLEQ